MAGMESMRKKKGAVLILSILLGSCGGGGGAVQQAVAPIQTEPTAQTNPLKARPLSSIEPNQVSDEDLAAFADSIGNARIVVLNESDHGVAETLHLITRLTQYLHKHKNFEVFLVESGLFDLQRMAEMKKQLGVSYLDSAPGRIYYATSRSVDGRVLVKYLDEAATAAKPLELTGIDVLMGGESAMHELFPRFEAFLIKNGSTLPSSSNWPLYKKFGLRVAQLEQRNILRPNASELAMMRQIGDQLKQELCFTPYVGESILSSKGYWCRVTDSLNQQLDYLWRNPSGELDWGARDIAQAANAAWFLEGPYKGKKAILFTHASHGVQNLAPSVLSVNTASELAKRYPGQIHTAMITARNVIPDNAPDYIKDYLPYFSNYYDKSIEKVLFSNMERVAYFSYSPAAEEMVSRATYMRGGNLAPTYGRFFGREVQTLFYIPEQRYTKIDWNQFPSQLWPQPLN